MLRGKKIILGICGSIAAYKSAFLIRLLKKGGAEVKVIMTASALDFITPLTLSTLSKNPVYTTFKKDNTGEWQSHVALGLWADLILIAPATANTIAKMTAGITDNLLLATYFSAKCPVMVAPAMDLAMYRHPVTQSNLEKLSASGDQVLQVEFGELASGLTGEGRMAEPEQILHYMESFFKKKGTFKGKRVLITSGPTYENIDPVRFIGNHSSGKMGYVLAHELACRGALVTLVSGPTQLVPTHPGIKVIPVTSAMEMLQSCDEVFPDSEISIFAAAVADFRPEKKHPSKIKKEGFGTVLNLVKNPDIALEMGSKKKKGQMNIGFALETENEIENATLKLKEKNFDFIVLNSLKDEGAGFGKSTNKIILIDQYGEMQKYPLKTKEKVAEDIIDYLSDKLFNE